MKQPVVRRQRRSEPSPILRMQFPEGYTDDPGEINTHGNSGSQAMQIAIKTGAAKVLLCGFDMHQREASHWHGDHPSPLRSTLAETYTVFIKRMERAAPLIAASISPMNRGGVCAGLARVMATLVA